MSRRGILVTALFVVAAAVPGLARDPMTLERLKKQAAADAESPEGQAYLRRFFTNPWLLALDSAGDKCRAAEASSEAHEEFVIALSIGENGYPIEVLVSPEDEELKCLAEQLASTPFIRPPHDGFAVYVPFEATDPGTLGRTPEPPTPKPTNP